MKKVIPGVLGIQEFEDQINQFFDNFIRTFGLLGFGWMEQKELFLVRKFTTSGMFWTESSNE